MIPCTPIQGRLLWLCLCCISTYAAAGSPPETFDLGLDLVPDWHSTFYTGHGYEMFGEDNPADLDDFRPIEDCDCHHRSAADGPLGTCIDTNNVYTCYCPTIAQTHYLLFFSDELPSGQPLYQLANTE